jgi:hypothetical protein
VRLRKRNSSFLATLRTPGHVRRCVEINPSTTSGHLRCRVQTEQPT